LRNVAEWDKYPMTEAQKFRQPSPHL